MPPAPRRRTIRYRFPVSCRSCVISTSGASLATDVIAGSVPVQRAHWTATARFHVPQSGQNRALPSELQANEIVGRPRPRQAKAEPRLPPRLGGHGVGKLAPLRPLHEERRAGLLPVTRGGHRPRDDRVPQLFEYTLRLTGDVVGAAEGDRR